MASSYNPNKSPPNISDSANYEDYKKLLQVWSKFTNLSKEKKGMAVFLTLKGADQEAVLELDTEDMASENDFENVIARLDRLYLKDETLQKYKAFCLWQPLIFMQGKWMGDIIQLPAKLAIFVLG